MNAPDAASPDALLERLARLSREAARGGRFGRLELYQRASRSVRVTRTGPGGEGSERVGDEEGTAVRVRVVGETGYRFAAATGAGGEAVDRALRGAVDGPLPVPDDHGVRGSVDEPLLDRDAGSALPSPVELRRWLEDALAVFRDSRLPEEAAEPDEAWVEVASTVETWAIDGKPAASRTRRRGWALLRPAPRPTSPVSPLPRLVAARSWDRLDAERWAEARAGAGVPARDVVEGVDRRSSLLFDPECSASLVLALARSVHVGPGPTGSGIGPGWNVWDAPDAPDSLFGGIFDDTGVHAPRTALADGERVVGRIEGGGHLRRPSFRDPPRPLPSHLLVDPRVRLEEPDAPRLSRVSIHPLPTGEWILDLEDAFVTTTPEELVGCCAAGVGAQRSSHRGVTTPALLFEGLTVRT